MNIKQTVTTCLIGIGIMLSVVAFVAPSNALAACSQGTASTAKCCGGVQTSIIHCDSSITNKKGGAANTNGVWGLLLIAINILTAGIGIVAIGGIVYASILFASAGDKAAQVQKAREIIANVVIGLIAFALMYAFLQFLIPGGVFNT